MKAVIFWTVALTCLFYYSARADETNWSLRFGPAVGNGGVDGQSKAFGLRLEEQLIRGIYTAAEVGGYTESRDGLKGAAVGKVQIGVMPGAASGLYGFAFFGPAAISATDKALGSNFQFATDIGLGVRDRYTSMSMGYGHISNAGLTKVNNGRDYILLSFGIRFNE